MFGVCRVCAEKEKRIQDLLAQVQMLREVAYPKMSQESERNYLEADRILSGSDEPIHMEPESKEQVEEMQLLTGSYDNY